MIPSTDWLALHSEEIIDPQRPICDPHHHLWDHPDNPYLLADLLADTGSGHNVVSTVFVECASMYRAGGREEYRPVGETEFVNGIAAMMASGYYGELRGCAGIVGAADLTLGDDIGPVLDEHMRLSPRFRGIRHAAGWDASAEVRNSHTNPPPHLFMREDFRAGFAQLEKRGLVFDAWLYHHQIVELTSLARAFPDTLIILDHFGGPLGIGPYAGKQGQIFEVWQEDLRQLSRCENVHAKLGGLVMPVNGFDFHKRAQPPSSDALLAATGAYFRHAMDCFGVERCMFESNFPVDKVSCSYAVLWNASKKMAAAYTASEQDFLFHDTASRVYSLTLR